MKYLSICALLLVICLGCKKAQDTPRATYPDSWGMIGVIDGDSFSATALYATTVPNGDSDYTIDISGWNNQTNQVIYLHFTKASLTLPKMYTLTPVSLPDAARNYAYYQSNYKDYARAGYVYIDSYVDSVLKGSYYFETAIGVKTKGSFAIKPNS